MFLLLDISIQHPKDTGNANATLYPDLDSLDKHGADATCGNGGANMSSNGDHAQDIWVGWVRGWTEREG